MTAPPEPARPLRIALVGPTHPYKGGVASHTTALAHELARAGHDVTLVAWSHLYPRLFYPGEQEVPGGRPDVEPFPRTVRALSWARPDTWVRTGRRLRGMDLIIVVHVIPPVVPSHLVLLKAAGIGRTSSTGIGPRSLVIAHNVLPHERHPGDESLMRQLVQRVDGVVVHSAEQAALASGLGAREVRVADLPPHLPGGEPAPREPYAGPARLLALGLVRDYKGIDLLMDAMAQVPGPTLTVAGEAWGETGDRLRALARDPRLQGRVDIRSGYVPSDELARLLAEHDVLSLTYRSATASQNALLGHEHGLAVLASRVGTFAEQVRDDIDGVLVEPDDREGLVSALRRLADPDHVARLLEGVRRPDLHAPWQPYLRQIEGLAAQEAPHGIPPRRSLPAITSAARATVSAVRRAPVALGPGDLPASALAVDLLTDLRVAELALEETERVGLPRAKDAVSAWAAWGALAAVLRRHEDRPRSAVILDESGPGSPLARWARAVGYIPLELELTGDRSSVSALDLGAASLDVVSRLHPGGCDADDIEQTLAHASWALRPGGLCCLTVTAGHDSVPGALTDRELPVVLARADEQGLVLVQGLDDEARARLSSVCAKAPEDASSHALLLLTFRRQGGDTADPADTAGAARTARTADDPSRTEPGG